MVRNFSILVLATLTLSACASTHGGHRGKHGVNSEPAAKVFVIEEDAPAETQTLTSGQDLMNKLIHMGKKEPDIQASPVTISPLAEDVEEAVLPHLNKEGPVKTYSFKGKDKPSDIKAWLAKQGVKGGRVLDTEVKSWGVKPYSSDKYHYLVYLNTQTTLSDLNGKKTVKKYSCATDTSSVDPDKAPTKYELLKDNKALIKRLYKERADECAKRTVNNIF